MIVGVGIDVVSVPRVSEKLARRVLSETEYILWEKKNRNQEFLAGRFALKEAFFKALGTGIRNYALKDISFIPDELGKVFVEESDILNDIKSKFLFDTVHLSLSHDGGIAVAVVILERSA